jgi:transposase
MPAPYSKDLRIRVIDAYSSNEYTIEQVSETFKVSIKTIKRWAELKEKTGDLNAKVGYQKGHSHAIKDLDEFKEIVISGSFSTVKDILEVVKVGTVHSIGRALKKINFTKKKHRTTYKEQKEQQVTEYKKVIEDLDINKFVYLDETGVEQRMMQGCSWMQRGLIKIEKVFGVRTARTNILLLQKHPME